MIGSSTRGVVALALTLGGAAPLPVGCPPLTQMATGRIVVVNDNGAWSWFEDERAVVDLATDTLLVGSVADAGGTGGEDRDGNVEVTAVDLATGAVDRSVLHARLEADDHDSPAMYVRDDGRYVAMYSRHATDDVTRWRVSATPGTTVWNRERRLDNGAATTYSNIVAGGARGAGPLHAFVRGAGRDPQILHSTDDGATWHHAGRLLAGPGRPYVRYAADRRDRVHLITTEQHPLDAATDIYHGVIDGDRLVDSVGSVVDRDLTDDDAAAPGDLTAVFVGQPHERAWTVDLQVDDAGRPYAVFSVYAQPWGRVPAHRTYVYARFDGARWHVHPLADAGRALYGAEPHYTGLVALDPHDSRRAFVSTDVHPATGAPLVSRVDGRRHHEIFEATTTDGGATWTWEAVTGDSTVDNIRPIVPTWDEDHVALLWLRGTYTTYHDYDLDVVLTIRVRRPPAA